MFAHTPICDESLETDLGRVLRQHITTYQADPSFSLGFTSIGWANVIRARAQTGTDARLAELTQSMLDLLAAPKVAGSQFKSLFEGLWDEANKRAYPLSSLLRDEKHAYIQITCDYTLECIDAGMVRVLEDRAVVDPVMRKFVDDMCVKLRTKGSRARYEILRQVFDIYSEALVYHLIRQRGGSRINVEKIPETREPTPDFCVDLVTDDNDRQDKLSFFVEVKSLDIVHAAQRLPEMLDDGMDAQIELERQLLDGKNVAIEMTEVAPYHPYKGPDLRSARRVIKNDPADYDPRSTRRVIESLIEKAAGNFKSPQFNRGPTFALLNVLRLPVNQGTGTLAPFFYDELNGGACVSGILWHVAFGRAGAPIHRSPEFEGGGTVDGQLQRAGILVDPALALPTPGLIVLHFRDGAYRLDGFYNSNWTDATHGWSNIDIEATFHVVCDEYNDQNNSEAWKYSRSGRRRRPGGAHDNGL